MQKLNPFTKRDKLTNNSLDICLSGANLLSQMLHQTSFQQNFPSRSFGTMKKFLMLDYKN